MPGDFARRRLIEPFFHEQRPRRFGDTLQLVAPVAFTNAYLPTTLIGIILAINVVVTGRHPCPSKPRHHQYSYTSLHVGCP